MLVEFKFDVVLYYKILISEMVFTANLLTSTENNIDWQMKEHKTAYASTPKTQLKLMKNMRKQIYS